MNHIFLSVASSPHIKDKRSTRSIMLDVLIALFPAVLMSLVYFGNRALWHYVLGIAVAVLSEYLWNHFMKKPQTIHDLSAAVTGCLLAMNVSPLTPVWVTALGAVFAIIIVKMIFGGIGQNFINPALAARAFMMASWPVYMTTFTNQLGPDAVAGPTLLSALRQGLEPGIGVRELLLGHPGGCLGETSALALLIGAAYLIFRRVIRWEPPLIYMLVAAGLCTLFAPDGLLQGNFLIQLFSGGLVLGACFMANDYSTSPMTRRGEIYYALGCAFLTFVIRRFGGYPEGVSYSILIMNLFVPLIDRWTIPVTFGKEARRGKKKA